MGQPRACCLLYDFLGCWLDFGHFLREEEGRNPGLDYTKTFAPVIKLSTVRVVLSLALLHNWCMHQLDVFNAFLHGELNEDIYMWQPKGFEHSDYPQHQSTSDHSIFTFRQDSSILILPIYVDDIAVFGFSQRLVDDFIESMKAEFAMKDLGSLHYFLGVEIVHNTAGALLLQRKYISNLLHRFDLAEVKPVQTPLYSKLDWHSVDTQLLDNPFMYRKMVGSLQYLSFTRPDIQYAVNMASQFLHQPRLIHFQAIKRIFRYLKGTPAHGLQLNKNTFHSLTPFLDSDWAGCTTTRRSTSRFCIFLGSNLISWSTKKQPIVVRLSTEAKYRALAVATTDVIWIQFLLRELGIYLPTPILAKCDNIGAIHLAHNPVFHSRSKHVALDYHFIREKIAQGDLTVSHVPTSQQLADVFTKDVSITKFKAFWVNLHVRSSSSDCGRVIRILL
ncbi:uncharacterized mitochondrial protein AtMg00810-like [Solanum verrucosum]|uniref:uncharacterized mitochondrial protein AtMg00810-like n=1 Tax=Solanum verrucosum TaxID=315347 RepID=UPI0020D04D10|nr:uncharacterized mitochondrial protein AtMg00810-like [Solanum verrucosum]